MKKDFLLSIVLTLFLISIFDTPFRLEEPEIKLADLSKDHGPVNIEYGLPVDSFFVEENIIQAG